MQTSDPSIPQNILRELRNLIPTEDTTLAQVLLAAERQAAVVLERLADQPATVPAVLGLFKHITVRYDISPIHVFSYWNGSTWIITVHGRLTADDRRFHVLRQLAAIIWDDRVPTRPEDHLNWLDHLTQHFAHCVLIPADQLQRLWVSGIRDIDSLGLHFGASHHTVVARLIHLRPWLSESAQQRPTNWVDHVAQHPVHVEALHRWLRGTEAEVTL